MGTDNYTSDSDWAFQEGDEIEKGEEFRISIGEEEIDHSKYTVERRLEDVDSGMRFYHVMNVFGDTHLYAASSIEGTYRSIDTGRYRGVDHGDSR